jgi:imidazolonepropionase-like amidohydrolase
MTVNSAFVAGPQHWVLVHAGLLIDGTGAAPGRRVGILIHDERIVEVGPLDSVRSSAPASTLEIDASSGTVIPGLIDGHMHVGYCGHMGIQQLEWPHSLEFAAVCAGVNASRALDQGYTSALDVGCRGSIAVAVRQARSLGIIRGPDLRVSGQMISIVGAALDLWPSTMTMAQHARLTTLVSGVEEIRRAIREQVKTGVDNIKVAITDSTVQAHRPGRQTTFSDEELAAAAEVAHQYGLSIAAHAEGAESIRDAIRAGIDTVQHASYIDLETIRLLEQHPRTRLVFTLGVYDGILERGPSVGYPAIGLSQVRDAWPRMLAGVRLAYDEGVPFAMGSDCGGVVHPHGRYARDVTLLVRSCHVSVEHAIRAVTSYAAQAAWLPDVGSLTVGQFADLVVIDGNLTTDIELIEREEKIVTVLQRGHVAKMSSRSGDRTQGRA